MARYIDADKFAKRIEFSPAFENAAFAGELLQRVVLDLLDNAPTADVVEVKHARWIEESSLYVHCSNCKTREYPREHHFKSEICPKCGAKMDGQ